MKGVVLLGLALASPCAAWQAPTTVDVPAGPDVLIVVYDDVSREDLAAAFRWAARSATGGSTSRGTTSR